MTTHSDKICISGRLKNLSSGSDVDNYGFKDIFSEPVHISIVRSDWHTDKATWVKPKKDLQSAQYHFFHVKNIALKIPTNNKDLENVFLEAEYILDLKDNWDDEGSIGYTEHAWKCSAIFIINFYKWLNGFFSGSLHLPKMHHGPNGTIDIAWNEDNFRLFVNIDKSNNKGTFYSDTPNEQFSEGEFTLDNFNFNLLPLPLKF